MASNTVQMVLNLKDNASKSLANVAKKAKATEVSSKGLGKAFAALGASTIAASVAFVKMGQQVADIVNKLNDMSSATGVSVNTLQDLQLMARATGLDVTTLERGLFKFTDTISEAKRGTKLAVDAFAELGLDPNQFKDNDEAVKKTIDALQGIDDVNKRNRLSMELFSASAKQMLKAMQTNMGNAAQAQDLLNIRMSESTEQSSEMQASLGLMEQMLDHMKVAAFGAFAGPGGFASGVAVVIGMVKAAVELVSQLGNVVIGLFKSIGYAVNAMTAAAQGDADSFYAYSEKAQAANKQMWEGMVKLALPFAEGSWIDVGVKGALDFEEAVEVLTRGQGKAAAAGGKTAGVLSKASQEAKKYKDELIGIARAADAAARATMDQGTQRFAYPGSVYGVRDSDADRNKQKIALAQGLQSVYDEALSEASDAVKSSAGYKSMQDVMLMLVDTGAGNDDLQMLLSNVMTLSTEYEQIAARFGSISKEALQANRMFKFAVQTTTDEVLEQNPALADLADGYDMAYQSVYAYVAQGQELSKLLAGERNAYEELGLAMDTAGVAYRSVADAQAYLSKSGPEAAEEAVGRLSGEAEALVVELERLGRAQADLLALGTDPGYQSQLMATAHQVTEKLGTEAGEQYLHNMAIALKDGIEDTATQIGTTELALQAVMKDLKISSVEVDEIKAKAARIDNLEAFTARMEQIGGVFGEIAGGDIFQGAGSALSAMGPYGAAAGSVVSAFSTISDLGMMAQDSSVKEVAKEIVQSAEDQIEGIETGLEVLTATLPDILAMLIVELPIAIIKALPAMVEALYLAFTRALGQLWGLIKGLFGGTKEERQERRQSRLEWASEWGSNFFNSIMGESERGQREGIESYAMGTPYVGRTGLALLHKGESVVPVNGRAQQGVQAGGAPVNINISASIIDRDVIPRLVREIERATGKYGRMTASFA